MFGKLMSISDPLMWRYIELLSFQPLAAIARWKADVEQGRNPRDIKVAFAQEIVARFHSGRAAQAALAEFEARFKQHEIPDDLPEHTVSAGASGEPLLLTQLLKRVGLTSSTSEAMRLIDQGGVRINGEKVSDKGLSLRPGQVLVLQVGKRKFARVTLA
jgi:tyrosyl-tRNA synthetase